MTSYLVDRDGNINHTLASGLLSGAYRRGADLAHRDRLELVPDQDRSPVFLVYDGGGEEPVATINAGAVPTAEALVDRLDQLRDELPDDRDPNRPDADTRGVQ